MLAKIAWRMATVAALKGATIVGSNVLDSEIGALEVGPDGQLRTDQETPFHSVYVDGAKLEQSSDNVLRALHASGLSDLTIETGITTTMTEIDQATGASTIIGIEIPATDGAFEFFLDCAGREVVNALTDPNNEWAEIWRGLTSKIVKVDRRRTSDATNGTRVAAHQLIITAELLPDPVFGEPVRDGSVWQRFFAKLAEDDDPIMVKKRAALMALIGSTADPLASESQRRRFGTTLEEARALFDIAVRQGEETEPRISDFTHQLTLTP